MTTFDKRQSSLGLILETLRKTAPCRIEKAEESVRIGNVKRSFHSKVTSLVKPGKEGRLFSDMYPFLSHDHGLRDEETLIVEDDQLERFFEKSIAPFYRKNMTKLTRPNPRSASDAIWDVSRYTARQMNLESIMPVILTIKQAKEDDVPSINEVYDSVLLTPDNIRQKLDPHSPQFFSFMGGIFTKPHLSNLISDKNNVALIVSADGNGFESDDTLGCFSSSLDAACFENDWTLLFDDPDITPEWIERFKKAYAQKKVAGTIDILKKQQIGRKRNEKEENSNQENNAVRMDGIGCLLKYEMMNRLFNNGITMNVVEIYTVTGVSTNGLDYKTVDYPNIPSINLNKNILGAKKIGNLPTRYFKFCDDVWARVRPDLYGLEITRSLLNQLQRRLTVIDIF